MVLAELKRDTSIRIKPFGIVDFLSGIYCYYGSACGPGGLNARLKRHLDDHIKKHWHFDYLKERLVIKEIWWLADGWNEA